jgi:hypothetical protein
MLSWSSTAYKFTLGIGSLGIAAAMAELWKPVLPIWMIMVIALLPLLVFVFVHPSELPDGFVRTAHVFASAWYVLSVIALSVGLYFGLAHLPVVRRGGVGSVHDRSRQSRARAIHVGGWRGSGSPLNKGDGRV